MEDIHKKLSSLIEISKTQLSKILNFFPDRKDLILDPSIIKPLERICGAKWLRENNIDKMYKLGSKNVIKNDNLQYYIIYTNMDIFKQIVDLIQSQFDLESRPNNKYHIICVPKSLCVFEKMLEEFGLFQTVVKLYSFLWQPIHIDHGLLSLEIPYMYKNIFVHQDLSLLQMYAKSLWCLSFVTGKPNMVLALGQYANGVIKQLDELYEVSGNTDKYNFDFSALIIIDRDIDYPSALLTPSTYTALLKEIYNVKCGFCEYKETNVEKYDNKFNIICKKNPIEINLDSKRDSVYNNIKNRYFTDVTSVLSALTKQLRMEGETSKEMALDEIKKYVQTQLQAATSKKKLVTTHLNAAETIINVMGHRVERQQEIEQNILQNINRSNNYSYLEETLFENDKLISLRLMCLMCVTQKLSENEVKGFLTKYYHEFGYNYGYLFNNLTRAGFVEVQQTLPSKLIRIPKMVVNNFYVNANKLKLIPNDPEKIDVNMPTCPSYVFGGCYIPLITQIASLLLSATPLKEIESKLETLGPVIVQNGSNYPLTTRSILVYVIGGVTYAEVAACNLLEVLTGSKITMISDQYVSGNDIVEGLMASPVS